MPNAGILMQWAGAGVEAYIFTQKISVSSGQRGIFQPQPAGLLLILIHQVVFFLNHLGDIELFHLILHGA